MPGRRLQDPLILGLIIIVVAAAFAFFAAVMTGALG